MNTQSQFTFHGSAIRDAKLLPVQPPGQVIGRNNELKSMHLALKAGSSVFLSGTAGIGKTALASVLATAYTASNPGGVLWFNCIEDDLRLLIARAGRAFGINSPDNTAAIRSVLVKNRPLIVLDGMIDVEAARKFVGDVAQGIATLITNETPGNGPWLPIGLETLAEADSAALLKFYSGTHDADYSADLLGLCKFLGGLPLAIELAGRHIAVEKITPGELLTSLPSSTGQDTAAMIMSVIFKRLPPAAQGLLLVLSATFTGIASAELMSDLSSAPIPTIIPLMRQLVARAIAREMLVYGQFAYRVHSSIQEYARIWLESYRRLQSTESRALESIATYTERHARDNAADHDRLAAEIDNIVGAAAYATETGQAAVLRQLTAAISQNAGTFVAIRGFGPELAQMRKLAILLSRDENELTQPIQVARPELFATPPSSVPEPPMDSQATPVVKYRPSIPKPPDLPSFSEPETTEPMLAEPPDTSSLDETQLASPISPDLLPRASVAQSPLTELEQKITEAQATGDLAGEASLLQTLGKAYADLGNNAKAKSAYRQALDAYERMDSPQGSLAVLEALANLDSGVDDATIDHAIRLVEPMKKSGSPTQVGWLYYTLADMQITRGEFPAALDNYKQAIEALRATEDWNTLGEIMNKLGNAYLAENQPQEGAMILEQALTIFRRVQRPADERTVVIALAGAYRKLMQWDRARDYYGQAIASAHADQDMQGEGKQRAELAAVYEMENDLPNAIQHYWEALYLAYQRNDTTLQARIAFQLGRLLIEDTRTLGQGLELLRDSDKLSPSTETKRLLSRATKRLERTSTAGIAIPSATTANRDYAAQIYEQSALSAQT